MKKYAALLLILIAGTAFARGGGHSGGHHSHTYSSGYESHSTTHVNGYTKRDGSYVAPHDRTTQDHTKNNNWSTKGNVNPETGKPGTKPDDSGY